MLPMVRYRPLRAIESIILVIWSGIYFDQFHNGFMIKATNYQFQ